MKQQNISAQNASFDGTAGQTDPAPPLLQHDVLGRLLQVLGPTRKDAFLDLLLNDLGAALDRMQQAVKRRDKPELRRIAHNLTALAATVGASSVETTARAISTRIDSGASDALSADFPLLARQTTRLVAEIRAIQLQRSTSTSARVASE